MSNTAKFAMLSSDLTLIAASVTDNSLGSDERAYTFTQAQKISSDLMNKACEGKVVMMELTLPEVEKYKLAVSGSGKNFADQDTVRSLEIVLDMLINHLTEEEAA